MKSNSIAFKLWAAIITLVLLIVLTLGLLVDRMITGVYYRQMREQLTQQAGGYAGLLGAVAEPPVGEFVTLLANISGTVLLTFDTEGRVQLNSGLAGIPPGAVVAPGLVERVLSGQTVARQGYEPDLGLDIIAVGVPVWREGQVAGAVLVLTRLGPLRAAMGPVRAVLWATGLGAAVLATLLAFAVAGRLSRPLVEVGNTARAIARGDFSRRAPVQGDDEVGALARTINEMAGDLQRLENTRREFLANVSHELRTPLSYIKGYAQILSEDTDGDEQERARFLGIIGEEADRMNALLEDLMDLTAMEQGGLSLHRQAVDVGALARAVVGRIEPRATAKSVTLGVDAAPGVPPVWADPGRLEQVLLNLLDNALGHTPPGGRISLVVRARGGEVALTVADTGPGIPAEHLPLVWERFHKVDRARRRDESGGYGLGLAIVRAIIQAHGGRVQAANAPGGGAAMTVIVPAAAAAG